MNKHSKTTSSSVKATRQSKDTKKREILLRAKIFEFGGVQVSLWDKDYEIGAILCPVEDCGINDFFYTILDEMLFNYLKSNAQGMKGGPENDNH